jgi:hypothetical protein
MLLQRKLLLHGQVRLFSIVNRSLKTGDNHIDEQCGGNLGGLQVGGGISVENAQEWIDFGANKVGRSCLCTRKRQANC